MDVLAEVGRQPWVVHPRMVRDVPPANSRSIPEGFIVYQREEGLRTSQAVSEAVTGGQVLGSIIMFSFVYLLLFVVWIYVLNDKIHKGPQPVAILDHTTAEAFTTVAAERIEHQGVDERSKRRLNLQRELAMDLHAIWFILLGVLLAGYAVLDGFDLGVGILHPLARNDHDRRLFINAIGPIWDPETKCGW